MLADLFKDKRIILGVTGSIAAYKAADLASKLTQAGAQVDVILTAAAQQFLTPLTFQSVTGRQAYVDADLWGGTGHVTHIGLGKAADLMLIAPASANTMARLAHGLGDNLLCVTALAASCPLIIAPAMDGGMFSHPATQANLARLQERGAHILGPLSGHLASGLRGVGRMMEPADILAYVRLLLAKAGPLHGQRVVVTAGGTQEPLDPVRVLANHSSGKQGYAVAQAALDLGAQVTLIVGPVNLPDPPGAQMVRVQTARQMLEAVLAAAPHADALVMAAAVADFRPSARADHKIKKKDGGPPTLVLENNPDILQRVAQARPNWSRLQVVVGFAAESENLLENAAAKLQAKRLDMIVANNITAPGSGFASETNQVTLLFSDGRNESLPLMSKERVAQTIMDWVRQFMKDEPPARYGAPAQTEARPAGQDADLTGAASRGQITRPADAPGRGEEAAAHASHQERGVSVTGAASGGEEAAAHASHHGQGGSPSDGDGVSPWDSRMQTDPPPGQPGAALPGSRPKNRPPSAAPQALDDAVALQPAAGEDAALDPQACLLHLVDDHAWALAQVDGWYRPPSLAEEGFIHLSTQAQILETANRFYRGQGVRQVLWVDATRVDAELKWEPAHDRLYPHLYGALPLSAVVQVTQLTPNEGGEFTFFI